MTKRVIVMGAAGFIGSHLVVALKKQGCRVRAIDIRPQQYHFSNPDEFIQGDLRDPSFVTEVITPDFQEVYQLAADMGGAGYIFSGEHDADVVYNSAMINLNVIHRCIDARISKVFFSSSACIYPRHNQMDPNDPRCAESDAYPADPDSEYGWEKLFSERVYLAFSRNKSIDVKIARFHNIYGPFGAFDGGKEKAPAAICRKVALAKSQDEIEVWGDGTQSRSFLYIDVAIQGVLRLMESSFSGPVNIGSDEMVTINQLVDYVCEIAGKKLVKKHVPGPVGVMGRTSHQALIGEKLGWVPAYSLKEGLQRTYEWICSELTSQGRLLGK